MPIQYAGGTNVNATFTGATKNDMLTNVLSNLLTAGWTKQVGVTPSTVTMTIASPCVVTLSAHGLADGTRIVFNTTGALPTGLSTNTVYFVKTPLTNTFNVSATSGGTAINTSGSQSGTHTMSSEILMQTASTPQSYALNCRFRDNGGTGIQFSIESTDGVKVGVNSTTSGQTLTPSAGRVWRICACQFQFMCWVVGDYNVGNEFICVTCPYVFPFLTSGTTYVGLMVGGGRGAGTPQPGGAGNWRYTLYNTTGDNNQNFFQQLWGVTLWDNTASSGSNNFGGTPCLQPQIYSGNQTANGSPMIWRYGNSDLLTLDTTIASGLTSYVDESKIRFQLWDTTIVTDSFQGDTTTSFDGHNWIAVTASQVSATRATLFVVTS